jgi:hypothetical protein
VTSAADDGTDGTLRYEIQNAVSGETIAIDPGINPTVTAGHIDVLQDITLVGEGMGQTTIAGPAADRVFLVNLGSAAKTATIQGLTITGGHAISGSAPGVGGASGGGIFLLTGHLVVNRVELAGNFAGNGANGMPGTDASGIGTGGDGGRGGDAGQGGAILAASGALTIRDSSFHDNAAGAAGNGGEGGDGAGGFPGGPGGDGGFGAVGGAISTFVATEIFNTTFTNNHASGGGAGGPGGIGGFGGAGGSGGFGGSGGAISHGPITPTMHIEGSTFTGNTAGPGGAGGPAVFGSVGGDGGDGGALTALGAAIVNSTFTGNQAGSGGAGAGPIGGGGAGGDGGAIQGNASLRFSTIAVNLAGGGGGGATPGPSGIGGGIHLSISQVVDASIVSGNSAAGSAGAGTANCGGVVPTGSHALTFPGATGCPGAVGNPLLGPLASNGGPTQTMALGAGSAAIDQVPAGECLPTDQRGVPRPQGAACDIGAFEAPPSTTPAATGKKKKCKKRKKHRDASAAKKKRCKKKKKR